MTPSSPESEWREWYRRNYGDLLLTHSQRPVHESASSNAWHAAAQRHDELAAAEREYLEACYAVETLTREESDTYGDCGDLRERCEAADERMQDAYAALRAARQPEPVDHLQAALAELDSISGTFVPQARQDKIRDHITAEIAVREKS